MDKFQISSNDENLISGKKSKIISKNIRSRKKQALSVTDTIIVLLLVTPLTVSFWRGSWEIIDKYRPSFPIWESTVLANCMYLVLTITKDTLVDAAQINIDNIIYKVLSIIGRRLYTYLFACNCVLLWNNEWKLFDQLFNIQINDRALAIIEDGPCYLISSLAIFHTILILFKSNRNCLTVPFMVALDNVTTTFVYPTRFNKKMEEKTTLYVLDCLFSVFIIGTLVVFVWRGAWVLMDIYLFPANEYWSAWGSLFVGYTAVAIAFLIQPIMRWLCDRLSGIFRLLIADVFLFFSFIGTVNVWRGIWNLLNLYFIPEDIELSAWITHWICLILLILLKCSNTLLVRGVYIDADEPAGKCVVFPIYYLRLIFQRERAKKINKKHQIEAMNRRKIELDSIKTECTCGAEMKNHVSKETQNHCPDV